VPGAFHGEVPGPVWPAEDSHSPWTGSRGPRQGRSGGCRRQSRWLSRAASCRRTPTAPGHLPHLGSG
jgi:hypothetical protein